MIINILLTVLGFFLLVVGADILVDGAGSVAKKFKIPVIVIGLTIVAIGTSMPEMVVSTAAAITGHSDMSIGNVVGSNIANLLSILGICAVIKPLKFKKQTKLIENFIAIATTIILHPKCSVNNLSNLTIEIAEKISKAIKELYGYELKIKEPNDLMLNNKKICGILTEIHTQGEKIKYLLISFGFNVNETEFSKETSEIATSLKKNIIKNFLEKKY